MWVGGHALKSAQSPQSAKELFFKECCSPFSGWGGLIPPIPDTGLPAHN